MHFPEARGHAWRCRCAALEAKRRQRRRWEREASLGIGRVEGDSPREPRRGFRGMEEVPCLVNLSTQCSNRRVHNQSQVLNYYLAIRKPMQQRCGMAVRSFLQVPAPSFHWHSAGSALGLTMIAPVRHARLEQRTSRGLFPMLRDSALGQVLSTAVLFEPTESQCLRRGCGR